jgi:Nucleotidyl transferase AbiEii toxin, Type IV TA system
MTVVPGPFSLERMVNAVEKVRQRLLRAAEALEFARIPYAVAGGNAVALWVSRVDESAVRNTRDVDILLRREDLDAAKAAMERAGFVHRKSAGMEVFLDGPSAKARDAVHIVFANEKVRPHEPMSNPDVSESETTERFRVLSLEALVLIKLTAFRDKDKVHIRDLIDVGLVDAAWQNRLPAELAARLKSLLDTPEG